MKKWLALSLVLVVALGLVPQQPAPSQAQEQVEISFVHIFGGDDDPRAAVVQGIADQFMAANPNVTITIQSNTSDYSELFNSSILAASQGNAPHIVQVEEGLTQIAVDSQLFLPISDIASEEQLAQLEDYIPQVTSFFTVDGKLWGLPWNTSNPLLYYNKGYFEAAGLDPNDPPATFDEILAACEQLMAAEIEAMTACMNFPLVTWFVEQWVAMQGAVLADNENGRSGRATEILLDSPEVLRVVEWMKVMADSGYYQYTGTPNDYTGEGQAFIGGQTAMHINTTAGLFQFEQFAPMFGVDLGVAGLPIPGEDATNGVTVGGASLFISAGYSEAETQAAVDFVFFLTNTENGALWHQGSGYFPNRQSTIDLLNEQNWFTEKPNFGIGLAQLQASQSNAATAGMVLGSAGPVRDVVVEALQSVVDAGADPAEAMAAAKARADAIIAEYNSVYE